MTNTLHRDPMQEFANRMIAELERALSPGFALGTRKGPADRRPLSIPSLASATTASMFSFSAWIFAPFNPATRAG